jgi:hypothetical protein
MTKTVRVRLDAKNAAWVMREARRTRHSVPGFVNFVLDRLRNGKASVKLQGSAPS